MDAVDRYFQKDDLSPPKKKDLVVDIIEVIIFVCLIVWLGILSNIKNPLVMTLMFFILVISSILIFFGISRGIKILPYITKRTLLKIYEITKLQYIFLFDTLTQLGIPKKDINITLGDRPRSEVDPRIQFNYIFVGSKGKLIVDANHNEYTSDFFDIDVRISSKEKYDYNSRWSIEIQEFSYQKYDRFEQKDMKDTIRKYRDGTFTGRRNFLIRTEDEGFNQRFMIRLENVDDDQNAIFHNLFNMDHNLEVIMKLQEHIEKITLSPGLVHAQVKFKELPLPAVEDFAMFVSFLFFGFTADLKCKLVDVLNILNYPDDQTHELTRLSYFNVPDTAFFHRCILCFQPLTHEEISKLSCCGIKAHTTHLQPWISSRKNCPYCKSTNYTIVQITI